MTSMPYIERITLYPIKSFDGKDVQSAELRANGGLKGDREFAFFTDDGVLLNGGKAAEERDVRLFKVRVKYDGALATFSAPGMTTASFDLHGQMKEISAWMSKALGRNVTLKRDSERGFCDDRDMEGPTLIASETLRNLGVSTNHPEIPEMHRRLRSNIVISGMSAFDDDKLYGAINDVGVPIQMGDLKVYGINPSIRCDVPTRDPETGEKDRKFAKLFTQARKAAVEGNSDAKSRMERTGYYRAGINTLAAGPQSGVVKIGDEVVISPLRLLKSASVEWNR